MPNKESYISEISIQNFKFFPKLEKSISVEGKHVLLYGENGAGKSSIYWALYTLLQCANKEDVKQIKKYFDAADPESLVNIHLKPGTPNWVDPYIQITFLDDTPPFYVSHDNTSINKNTDAQEVNFASDFINYRSLLSLYNFSHSDDIDLFPFFKYAVFPYLKFTPFSFENATEGDIPISSANKQWEEITIKPEKNKLSDYKSLVNKFYTDLQNLILI